MTGLRIFINHVGVHMCLDCGTELARNAQECPVCASEASYAWPTGLHIDPSRRNHHA